MDAAMPTPTPSPPPPPSPTALRRRDAGALLVRHRGGDPDAFAALVEDYRAPIYSHLYRCGIEPDDRDDLFQDIFLRIHRAAATYREELPAHPWIFTIVANAVRNHLRRRKVRSRLRALTGKSPDDPPLDPPDPAPDGERRAVAREEMRLIEEEIPNLPEAQRQALLLAGVEKLSMKDAAQALGIPVNTVKTHLRRARLRLARALVERRAAEAAS